MNSELLKAAEISVEELKKRHGEELAFNDLILSAPDSYLRRQFDKLELEGEGEGITSDEFLAYIHKKREQDPDFLEPLDPSSTSGQMRMATTGTSYNIAKLTASLTNSYLVTDLYSKWKEIELDREAHSAENKAWAPFAKALQSVTLPYLDKVRLQHAMKVRKEGRLESLRVFLRKVWQNACSEDSFDSVNAQLLADELLYEIKKAEEEWKQIDRDIIKYVGAEVAAGVLSASSPVAAGYATFLAAAAVVTGLATLTSSVAQHRGFPDKFPAAFFMKLSS